MAVPAFFRSIRLRLALTYSLVVFGMALVLVGGVNYALSASLEDQRVARQVQVATLTAPDGSTLAIAELEGLMLSVEQLVNQRALENLRRYSLWALFGLFPASILAGWVIADRTLRPIGSITGVAREIQATDLTRRIDLGGPDDELRQLADTFDAMLDRLEAGVESQRNFIQDTTHELRNPLAVIATNLDVALSDPDADIDGLRRTAEIVRRTVDRASRTVDELAMYARRDVPESVREPLDTAGLMADVLEEYRGPLEEQGVTAEWLGGGVTVSADRTALKRAFGNLVNNAIRLSRPGATMRVGTGRYRDFAWIGVEDEGPGIDPRDHAAVFQRYWSGDPSSIRQEGRSGLGLAIVRQIVQAHGGLVTVRSVRGAGAAFVLWLPMIPGANREVLSDDGIHPVHDPFTVTI